MSHAYICNKAHIIFSTAGRRKWIREEVQPELWKYIGGVARAYGMKAQKVGGVEDHVHILLSIPATISVAKAVQVIKANSSRWMKTKVRQFAWQKGYAAGSVSASRIEPVSQYIANQRQHHQRQTFEDELLEFLKRHRINTTRRRCLINMPSAKADSRCFLTPTQR
jgi:REP element-mobilizing transposase RayT